MDDQTPNENTASNKGEPSKAPDLGNDILITYEDGALTPQGGVPAAPKPATPETKPVPPPPLSTPSKPAPIPPPPPPPLPPPAASPPPPPPKKEAPPAEVPDVGLPPRPNPQDGAGGLINPKGPFRNDIADILKEIKLPERRGSAPATSVGTTRNTAESKPSSTPQEPSIQAAVIVSEVTKPQAKSAVQAPPTQPPPPAEKKSTPDTSLSGAPKVQSATVSAKNEAPRAPTPPATFSKNDNASKAPAAPGVQQEETRAERSIVTPLRTLKEDLQSVVREKKISIVHAVALEEEKKRDRKMPTAAEIAAHKQRAHRTFAVLFSTVTLLFLGAAALFGVYTIQKGRTASTGNQNDTSILFAEQSVSFSIGGQTAGDIKRTLASARDAGAGALGSITRIVPTLPSAVAEGEEGERAVTTAEFLSAIDANVSDDFLRALADQFFLGIHTVDKNAPILVIPVLSYDHAFAGMLAWEKSMNTDLTPAFISVSPLMVGENGLLVDRPFNDIVMRNYDARALKDDGGNIILYYSFPTPNILVIAESQYSFTEVLSRLQAARKL